MGRSVKKGPFSDGHLVTKVAALSALSLSTRTVFQSEIKQ
jgi:ribosomal protein S19